MDIIEQVRQNLKDTLRYIHDRSPREVRVGIILGSGLGGIVEAVENPKTFAYKELPYFPKSTIEGHAGNLVLGTLSGCKVAIMQGRFHYYEGYTSTGIAYPIRVMRGLGVKVLIVTCAAGALNKDFEAGDIMIITDHVNLMGGNPLVGPNDNEIGPRFVNMMEAYDKSLIEVAHNVGKEKGVDLREGVYVGVLGPSYETKAEIRFLESAGDAVGMSTVPEVIVARHAGMKVLGLSVITNSPHQDHAVSHDDVLNNANRASHKLNDLIINILANISV